MDSMAHGAPAVRSLLGTGWRALFLTAVAGVQGDCSPIFLADIEPSSSFHFQYLGERSQQLAGREAFYDVLFDAFVEAGAVNRTGLPIPPTPGLEPEWHAGRRTPGGDRWDRFTA
jgi:hypothetical protein